MAEIRRPEQEELPTKGQLAQASIVAVFVAGFVLFCAVLPAEFGIDPTGVGRVLGLDKLSAVASTPTVTLVGEGESRERADELKLTLQPGQGSEIKVVMRAADSFSYQWSADAGPLFFDFHGDPKDRPASEFVSYNRGSKQADEGNLQAEFAGKHGWYWKNKNGQAVTVTLKTRGVYQSVSRQ